MTATKSQGSLWNTLKITYFVYITFSFDIYFYIFTCHLVQFKQKFTFLGLQLPLPVHLEVGLTVQCTWILKSLDVFVCLLNVELYAVSAKKCDTPYFLSSDLHASFHLVAKFDL